MSAVRVVIPTVAQSAVPAEPLSVQLLDEQLRIFAEASMYPGSVHVFGVEPGVYLLQIRNGDVIVTTRAVRSTSGDDGSVVVCPVSSRLQPAQWSLTPWTLGPRLLAAAALAATGKVLWLRLWRFGPGDDQAQDCTNDVFMSAESRNEPLVSGCLSTTELRRNERYFLQVGSRGVPWRCTALPPSSAVTVSWVHGVPGDYDRRQTPLLQVSTANSPLLTVLMDRLAVGVFDANLVEFLERLTYPMSSAEIALIVLYLLETGETARMPRWLERMPRGQWLPDTWAAYAWLRLYEKGAEGDARGYFNIAARQGVPVFTLGLRRLLSGLELTEPGAGSGRLAGIGKEGDDRPSTESSEPASDWQRIRRYAMSADYRRPLTSFFGTDPATPALATRSGIPSIASAFRSRRGLAEPAVAHAE